MAKSKGNVLGKWAFLVGVLLALVIGFIGTSNATWAIVLVAIGLIVGLLNIADDETQAFLMSGVILVVTAAFGSGVMAETGIVQLTDILYALMMIFVPATIIVAIKNVFTLARD